LQLNSLGAICTADNLKWLSNLQDPSSRLTRWAMKLIEYDFTVEHRPDTKVRHTDALSRCIHVVTDRGALTREVIRETQNQDPTCEKYKTRKEFWLDDEENVVL
jgi:hypothetical protein